MHHEMIIEAKSDLLYLTKFDLLDVFLTFDFLNLESAGSNLEPQS